MNFKLDANSLPKLSKEKWLSSDMHAETLGVITFFLGMALGQKKKWAPQDIDNIKNWTRASLEEDIRVADDRKSWRKNVVQLERLTSELTTPD